jgi:hypothetical protein
MLLMLLLVVAVPLPTGSHYYHQHERSCGVSTDGSANKLSYSVYTTANA